MENDVRIPVIKGAFLVVWPRFDVKLFDAPDSDTWGCASVVPFRFRVAGMLPYPPFELVIMNRYGSDIYLG
jgi:hypothetical protein